MEPAPRSTRTRAAPSRAGTATPVAPARLAVLVAALLAVAAALLTSTQILLGMLDHGHEAWRIFAWQLAGWLFWVPLTPPLLAAGGRLLDAERRPRWWWLRHAAGFAAAAAVHVAAVAAVFLALQPYVPVATYSGLEALDLAFSSWVAVDPLLYGVLLVTGYALAGQAAARRSERLAAELDRARLEALRLEIQPHFLFNSLNSIAAQIRTGAPAEALEMLLGLSELLRATLERSLRPLVSLEEEIGLLRRYVALQEVRFADRLAVRIEVDDDTRALAVPVFVLQPLVENAIHHGVGRRTEGGHVEVQARRDGDRLVLTVDDDGPGPTAVDAAGDGRGVGLANVRSRLERLYGDAAELTLTRRPGGGARARIILPPTTAADAALRVPA